MVPKSENAPLSASLLLRLAEAVDGYRDGVPRWFLIARQPPHHVSPFPSEDEANAALKEKKPAGSFVVLGPYVAGPEAGAQSVRKKKPKKRIKSIQIHYEGSKKPVELDPSKVDAIFLSASSLDKFVYPYYSRVSGVDQAARMRERHMSADEEPSFFHEPWSGP
jgi:hypothetical protein